MTALDRTAATDELERIRNRAEALADTLDPGRTFSAPDEVTRSVVRACDIIAEQASRALSMLAVTGVGS